MILCFSGTGNSKYAAKRIAEITGDELVDLNIRIKNRNYERIKAERIVFVVPTYGWRMPKIVTDWINRTDFDCEKVWFVMTCGGEIGNAPKYNRQICEQKHFRYMGTKQILMPENYIAMFGAPTWDEAEKIIDAAEPDIQNAGERIKAENEFSAPRNNLYDKVMSDIVNPIFYKFCVKSKAYYTKDSCVGCGKCVALCPMNNIEIKNGKPIWGRDCTHCMACICHCPAEAIEYGKKSAGKPRYTCKK